MNARLRGLVAAATPPYLLDEELAALEGAVTVADGPRRLALRVQHAWHLRQRDPAAALAQAAHCESEFALAAVDPIAGISLRARLALTRGEIALLSGEPVSARQWLQQALDGFAEAEDLSGLCDAQTVAAHLAHELGHCEERNAAILQAVELARRGGDELRARISEASYACFDDYSRFARSQRRWEGFIADCEADPDPCVRRIALEYGVLIQGNAGDFVYALRCAREAVTLATRTGHLRQALMHRTNAGQNLWMLGEYDAALEELQEAIRDARARGWPVRLSAALQASARVLLDLGHPAEARRLAEEAYRCTTAFPKAFNVGLVLHALGDIELADGRVDVALAYFERALAHGRLTRAPAMEMRSLITVAKALLRLGRVDEASAMAESSLALARRTDARLSAYQSLRVLADIHERLRSPAPAGSPWPDARLHYLQAALTAAGEIEGYAPQPQLFECLAQAHAEAGDFRAAYAHAQSAEQAHAVKNSRQAVQAALAFEIRRENDRIRAQAAHEQALAQAHREHARALRRHGETLQRLAAVGREITAHLDSSRIFEALQRHAHALMDASSFCVYLLSDDGPRLACVFGREDGQPVPPYELSLDDPTSNVAECARSRRDSLGPFQVHDPRRPPAPGTRRTRSTLYAPLSIGERLLGVLTVQAFRERAYGERERAILRTLAGFLSVALENARACAQLHRLQPPASPVPPGAHVYPLPRGWAEAISRRVAAPDAA
ncbi:MAG TPA: GAF domain-containing protein [Burkholderiaceae bacterium]